MKIVHLNLFACYILRVGIYGDKPKKRHEDIFREHKICKNMRYGTNYACTNYQVIQYPQDVQEIDLFLIYVKKVVWILSSYMPKQLAPIGSNDEKKHYHCTQSSIKCGEIKRARPRMVNTYLRNWNYL